MVLIRIDRLMNKYGISVSDGGGGVFVGLFWRLELMGIFFLSSKCILLIYYFFFVCLNDYGFVFFIDFILSFCLNKVIVIFN